MGGRPDTLHGREVTINAISRRQDRTLPSQHPAREARIKPKAQREQGRVKHRSSENADDGRAESVHAAQSWPSGTLRKQQASGKPEPESESNRTGHTHRPGQGHTGGPLGVGSGTRRRDGLCKPSLPDGSTHRGGGQPHCVPSCPPECHECPLHLFTPSELLGSPGHKCTGPDTPTCPLSTLTHPSQNIGPTSPHIRAWPVESDQGLASASCMDGY